MLEPMKRFSLSLLILIFLSTVILGSVSYVQPAQAILPVHDAGLDVKEVKTTIGDLIKTAILNASLQAMSYFTRKFAYDSAVWLSSGGKGQNPFAHTSSFGDYVSQTADSAVGAGIEALGKPFGLNLCHIPDVRLDLTIRLSLPNLYGIKADANGEYPPKPNCSFSDFQKNWSMKNFNSMYGSDNIADRFNADFKTDQSDLGLFIGATTKIDQMRAQEVYNSDKQRTEDQGAKGFTDLIAGNIKTPGQVMMGEIKAQSPSEGKKTSDEQINSAFSAGVAQILPSTLSVFLNTLASKMLSNYQTNGMFPFGIGYSSGGGSAAEYAAQGPAGGFTGRRLAQELFSDYKVANVKSVDNYGILARFQACPDNPAVDNCVINEDLMRALQEGAIEPVTIGEALQRTILAGDRPLIPPSRVPENKDKNCRDKAYCYRNVQMLRKARILPLGFEIATAMSDPDKPWTLKQVVDGYNNCEERKDSSTGKVIGIIYDPVGHPFCHLIDPNWILKVPDTKCNSMAIVSDLMSPDLPNRQEECVDFSSCVQYKDNQCVAYGYCTKERNVWNFSVDTCDAQNNSCRTFSNATTGEQVSYLYRTLDTTNCDANSVGCRNYALNQVAGQWSPDVKRIYLNKKVATNCTTDSLGCTAFDLVNNPGGTPDFYLRKAPDYLKCYDKTPAPDSPSVDWPLTESDLSLLQPQADCSKYAKPCIPDEVGCNWYTPVDYKGTLLKSENIPGKYTPGYAPNGDQCQGVCVGYDAYREMSSNFSTGENLTYIIPKSGRECAAAEEGCSGFTNLSTTAGNLEQVDYYSYLRSCILPDSGKQKNFYTYAGSAQNGYELIVYDLQEDKTGASDPTGQAGGPQYSYKTVNELADYKFRCNETQYRLGVLGLGGPDCRQFNDAKGQIYYRLLSQTVAVSDQCTPYRLNETALTRAAGVTTPADCSKVQGRLNVDNTCDICLQNGEYRADDGHCYYYGLPAGVVLSSGQSTACSAAANTCRQYQGSRANDVKASFFADFDEADKELTDWSVPANKGTAVLSLESTHLGQHSLMFNVTQASGEVRRRNLDLIAGDNYEISFWAKGDAGIVTVSLLNGIELTSTELGSVSVSNVWRSYKLGSNKILAGSATSTILSFKAAAAGHLFLDNIRLTRVNDVHYLIKNTLKVDPLCDSDLNDNNPGEALGCTEYRTTKNEPIFLTNFSYLCREGAIGCTALLDTQNTLNTDQGEVFNLWVTTDRMADMKGLLGLSKTDKDPCTVPSGEKGCNIVGPIVTSTLDTLRAHGGVPSASTVFIPPDTSTTTPMYLVNSETERVDCNPSAIGCMEAGAALQVTGDMTFVTTTIQNDPAQYVSTVEGQTGILCQSASAGCDAFNSKLGNVFFKDPKIMGGKICAYNDKVTINGGEYKGWFWKDVGRCANAYGKTCASDADCPGSTCPVESKNTVPCYSDYLQGGDTFGLWSYGNRLKYLYNVGECSPAQDSCKEFVDHNDNDHPYYLIANDKMTQGDCDNGVSRKYGCILLDDTGQPNKLWSSNDTYNASAQKDYEKVQPVVGAANDANIIAKVARDRECAEWIYPSQIHPNSEGVNKSYGLGVCDKAQTGTGFITQCVNDITGTWKGRGQFFDEAKYVQRPISWNDLEYSGFSLFDSYQMVDLKPVSNPSNPDQFGLVYEDDCVSTPDNPDKCKFPAGCADVQADATHPDGTQRCGLDNDHDGTLDGWCVKQNCTYPASGVSDPKSVNLFGDKLEGLVCRGYPETDSPFPSSVLTSPPGSAVVSYVQGFDNVKVCSGDTCECDYQKVGYGAGGEVTQYYGLGKSIKVAPLPDVPNPYSTVDNVLVNYPQSKISKFNGWWGYCVERDVRGTINGTNENSCLTWLPMDVVTGGNDIFSSDAKAGYGDVAGDRYICLRNSPVVQVAEERKKLIISPIPGPHSDENSFTAFNWGTIDDQVKLSLPGGMTGPQTDGGLGWDMWVNSIRPNTMVVGYRWSPAWDNKEYHQHLVELVGDNSRVEKYIPLNKASIFLDDKQEGYLDMNELEKIDVYMGSANHYPGGGHTFSFSRENIEGHTCGRDPVNGTGIGFNENNNCMQINPQLDGMPSTFRTLTEDKLYYWEWIMDSLRSDTVNQDFDYREKLGHVGLQSEITSNPDVYYDPAADEQWHASPRGLGIRVVFENMENGEKKLLGIWLMINEPNTGNVDEVYAGFFFLLHFTNGRCQEFAQISQAGQDIGAKPVTWLLRTDHVDYPAGLKTNAANGRYYNVTDRDVQFYQSDVQNNDFNNKSVAIRPRKAYYFHPEGYGLSKNGTVLPTSTPIWVDDFDVNNIVDKKFEGTPPDVFTGGIPLGTFTANIFPVENTSPVQYKKIDFMDLSQCNLANGAAISAALPLKNATCSMLALMFSKVFNVFSWDDQQEKYVAQNKKVDAASPEYASDSNSKLYRFYVPKIASVDTWSCDKSEDSKTGCGLAKLDTFSVNDIDNDDVFIVGNGAANIKFFAWADGAQMPLKRFQVDFNNGTFPYVSKADEGQDNFKPFCDDATSHCTLDENIPCVTQADCTKIERGDCEDNSLSFNPLAGIKAAFGSTTDTGCLKEYYKVYGQYSCDISAAKNESGIPMWSDNLSDTVKYNPALSSGGHLAVMRDAANIDLSVDARGLRNKPWELLLTETAKKKGLQDGSIVCAYQPKVQVLDNWGWCSGRCNHGAYNFDDGKPKVPENIINNWPSGCYSEMPTSPLQNPPAFVTQCANLLRITPGQNIQNYIPFGGFGSEKNVIVIPASQSI